MAAGYGITYEMLTMDYSRVNFTSGRMAKIDVTANFKSWQYFMIVPQICAPVWNWFISACMIKGELSSYISADWTAPRVQQLDPQRETAAQLIDQGRTCDDQRDDPRDGPRTRGIFQRVQTGH